MTCRRIRAVRFVGIDEIHEARRDGHGQLVAGEEDTDVRIDEADEILELGKR